MSALGVATFAALFGTLYAAHDVADHVFGQTDAQALTKGEPGRRGWAANLRHVAAYHVVVGVMLGVVVVGFDLPVGPLGLLVGLSFSAASHAVLRYIPLSPPPAVRAKIGLPRCSRSHRTGQRRSWLTKLCTGARFGWRPW